MNKLCNVCGQEKEHKSWKSTTCNECLESGLKFCSECKTVQDITNFHLCRGKPIGRCKACECFTSYDKKKKSGYLVRPDVIQKRNESSRLNKQESLKNQEIRERVYARHNELLRKRYAEDASYREKVIASNRQYKEGMIGILTGTDWAEALEFFNNKCAYCGKEAKLVREHVVPVSKNGLNIRSNVVPACASCNSSKHANEMHTWFKQQIFFSEERFAKILEWNGGDA